MPSGKSCREPATRYRQHAPTMAVAENRLNLFVGSGTGAINGDIYIGNGVVGSALGLHQALAPGPVITGLGPEVADEVERRVRRQVLAAMARG